jgi:hypothetical protein
LSSNFTVSGSITVTALIAANSVALGLAVAGSRMRSNVYFTSSASKLLPLWNLTPLRKRNT